MPSMYAACYTHLVFSTKLRKPLIALEVRPRLFAYIGGICRNINCTLVDAGGIEDHVQLLIRRHPAKCESVVMRDVKANSSAWMKKFEPGFGWQDGGGAFTVGPRDLEQVRSYLERQDEHHRRETFQDEFLKFLTKYEIDYDPRYVFE